MEFVILVIRLWDFSVHINIYIEMKGEERDGVLIMGVDICTKNIWTGNEPEILVKIIFHHFYFYFFNSTIKTRAIQLPNLKKRSTCQLLLLILIFGMIFETMILY